MSKKVRRGGIENRRSTPIREGNGKQKGEKRFFQQLGGLYTVEEQSAAQAKQENTGETRRKEAEKFAGGGKLILETRESGKRKRREGNGTSPRDELRPQGRDQLNSREDGS